VSKPTSATLTVRWGDGQEVTLELGIDTMNIIRRAHGWETGEHLSTIEVSFTGRDTAPAVYRQATLKPKGRRHGLRKHD
jgi:hypothetical protein